MKQSNKKGAKNNNKFGPNPFPEESSKKPLKLENFCVFQDHLESLMDLNLKHIHSAI